MQLIDTHAHLDQDEFAEDRDEVISRAEAAGVETVITVGVGADSSRAAIELAGNHKSVYAAVGIQPNYCGEAQEGDWDKIVEMAGSPRVVAIGETGLDRYWDYSPWDVQLDYFGRHLELAQRLDLPFIVHTRESDQEVLEMLRRAREQKLCGVMHSFTGSAEVAAECVDLGMSISFAGMMTFKKSDALRSVAASIPDDRILIETDSPYLSPHPLRGRRNEPAHLVHTAQCLADLRGEDIELTAGITRENARRLFRLTD